MAQTLELTFWGVRGSLPTPLSSHMSTGGNTSCVELQCNGLRFFFDAGTGLYRAGQEIIARPTPESIHILLSHTHIDHILGLPFFQPAYQTGYNIHIWAGHLLPQLKLEHALDRLMSPPLFPLTRSDFNAKVRLHDFIAGETPLHPDWEAAGISLATIPLNHPDRATGYRLSFNGKSVSYITDIEHTDGILDEELVEFIQGSDCLIYDSTYSDEDFSQYKGWGHSTWQHAVGLSQKANVKRLALFHHHQDITDRDLEKREIALQKMFSGGFVSREGLKISI